jgi:hypothetical protein
LKKKEGEGEKGRGRRGRHFAVTVDYAVKRR